MITIKNYEKDSILSFIIQDDIITYISLNNDGTLLASTNDKGIIIRIHNTLNGDLLTELKRGKKKAEINYICFDNDSNYMIVCSTRKTIHIWSMKSCIQKKKEKEINENKK